MRRIPSSSFAGLLVATCLSAGCGTNAGWFGDAPPDANDLPAANADDAISPIEASGQVAAAGPAATRWARAFGKTGSDAVTALVADAAGNAYITGYFSESIDLGCGPHAASGELDMFVAKLTREGACVWSAPVSGTSAAWGTALALDAQGSVYVAGQFRGGMKLGAHAFTSTGWIDGFVARFDAAGAPSWVRRVGDGAMPGVIAVHAGEVALGGAFFGRSNFGGDDLVSEGDEDAFIAGYDAATGDYRWQRGFGGPAGDSINALAFDAEGSLTIAGHFEGTLHVADIALVSAGRRDAFFAVLASGGLLLRARRFGGEGDDSVTGGVIDGQDNLVLTGVFQHAMDLGGLIGMGDNSGFVAKFGPDAEPRWSTAMTASSHAESLDVVVDEYGDIFVSGTLTGFPMTGLGTRGARPKLGSNDAFVAQYSDMGELGWSRIFSTGRNVQARAVTIAGSDLVVVGSFDGTLDAQPAMTSRGATDALIMAIAR